MPSRLKKGWLVLVPVLVDRSVHKLRAANLTNREYIYRAAFELGRHLTGYEVQMVLAGVDFFARSSGDKPAPIGAFGWGEGGRVALFAAALDTRIQAVGVSGHFASRQNTWQEPLDRNVFGLLEQFGDAELASLVAPRSLVVEAAVGAEVEVPPGTGGGPGRLVTPDRDDVNREFVRAKGLVSGLKPAPRWELAVSGEAGAGPCGSERALSPLLNALADQARLAPRRAAALAAVSAGHRNPERRLRLTADRERQTAGGRPDLPGRRYGV